MNTGDAIDVLRYTLPLVQPLHLHSTILTERTGLIIRVTREDGSVGLGEAAPLPGFSVESLDDATRWFLQGASGDKPPSVSFGWDTAMARSTPSCPCVLVNGLIARAASDTRAEARALRDQGYRAVKLKVGGRDVADDIAAVHAVAEDLDGSCTLRLDANRAWDWDTAITFSDAVAGVDIEYIEEPLRDPTRLMDLLRVSRIPLALDETVLSPTSFSELIANGAIRAVVLKPTLLGSLDHLRRLVDRTIAHGATPVFSACFESGIGIAAIARLAASLVGGDVAHGLDTYRWLARDVLKTPLAFRDGALRLEHAAELDMSVLEPVWHGQ